MLNNLNTLCKFASTDETRINLQYCVHNADLKALVATDGHKIVLDRSAYIEDASPFKASTYLKTGDLVKPDWDGFKYPHVPQFMPNLETYSKTLVSWGVPKWVSKINGRGNTPIFLTLEGDIMFTRPKHTLEYTSLDLKQLAPLAEYTISFKVKMQDKGIDKLAPVYFEVSEDFFGVIMPLRV